jgi:phosphonate transport system permease protein
MKTFLMEHKRWFQTLFVLIGMFLLIQYLKIDLTILLTDLHYVVELLNEMFPPNFEAIWDNNKVLNSILETISMAYLGTLFGGLIAFLFSIIASNNIFNFILIGRLAKLIL